MYRTCAGSTKQGRGCSNLVADDKGLYCHFHKTTRIVEEQLTTSSLCKQEGVKKYTGYGWNRTRTGTKGRCGQFTKNASGYCAMHNQAHLRAKGVKPPEPPKDRIERTTVKVERVTTARLVNGWGSNNVRVEERRTDPKRVTVVAGCQTQYMDKQQLEDLIEVLKCGVDML